MFSPGYDASWWLNNRQLLALPFHFLRIDSAFPRASLSFQKSGLRVPHLGSPWWWILSVLSCCLDVNSGSGINQLSEKSEKVKMLVVQSCPTLATPWATAHQAPLSTGFSRQESWSGLPFPPPGDLPNPRISLMSLGLLHCRWNLYHQAAWEAPLPSHTVQTVYIVSVSDGNSLACLSDGGEWSQVCMDS